MNALGKIVKCLGLVNEPYEEYPDLFESLVTVIKRRDVDCLGLRLQVNYLLFTYVFSMS
jgi:hypothetical protein